MVSPKNATVPPKKFLMTSFSPETEEEPPIKPYIQSSIPQRARPTAFVNSLAAASLRITAPKVEERKMLEPAKLMESERTKAKTV